MKHKIDFKFDKNDIRLTPENLMNRKIHPAVYVTPSVDGMSCTQPPVSVVKSISSKLPTCSNESYSSNAPSQANGTNSMLTSSQRINKINIIYIRALTYKRGS